MPVRARQRRIDPAAVVRTRRRGAPAAPGIRQPPPGPAIQVAAGFPIRAARPQDLPGRPAPANRAVPDRRAVPAASRAMVRAGPVPAAASRVGAVASRVRVDRAAAAIQVAAAADPGVGPAAVRHRTRRWPAGRWTARRWTPGRWTARRCTTGRCCAGGSGWSTLPPTGRVARRGDDRVDLGVGRDGLDESVFTGAGAEDENLHGAHPIGSRCRPCHAVSVPDTHPAPDHDAWLVQTLQSHREAVLWKLDGLCPTTTSADRLTPTGTNLLGLVKHLA